jgi:ATP-dependent DNA ligase
MGGVAKRRDSRYRSGRCREWIKVKNRAHPAFERAMPIAAELERPHQPMKSIWS